MTGRDPSGLTQTVLEALAATKQRGILLTGSGGMDQSGLPETVFQLESIPHDWLFPQVTAIVHHGGAGTTAAAMRAGLPSIVVPFFSDQPFWGDRVATLGIGTKPIAKQFLTVERLAAAIQSAVTDTEMRSRAIALGEKIRAENGVQTAVAAIHQHLSTRSDNH